MGLRFRPAARLRASAEAAYVAPQSKETDLNMAASHAARAVVLPWCLDHAARCAMRLASEPLAEQCAIAAQTALFFVLPSQEHGVILSKHELELSRT